MERVSPLQKPGQLMEKEARERILGLCLASWKLGIVRREAQCPRLGYLH